MAEQQRFSLTCLCLETKKIKSTGYRFRALERPNGRFHTKNTYTSVLTPGLLMAVLSSVATLCLPKYSTLKLRSLVFHWSLEKTLCFVPECAPNMSLLQIKADGDKQIHLIYSYPYLEYFCYIFLNDYSTNHFILFQGLYVNLLITNLKM